MLTDDEFRDMAWAIALRRSNGDSRSASAFLFDLGVSKSVHHHANTKDMVDAIFSEFRRRSAELDRK